VLSGWHDRTEGSNRETAVKPRLFIASSAENLEVAYAAQEGLDRFAEVTVWPQDIFQLSQSSIESLLDTLDECDYGLFVFVADDVTKMRSDEHRTVRDNVVLELGLFIGRLGRARSFILAPRNEEYHLPTDLLGMTPVTYDPHREDQNLVAGLGPACNRIRKVMEKLGRARRRDTRVKSPQDATTPKSPEHGAKGVERDAPAATRASKLKFSEPDPAAELDGDRGNIVAGPAREGNEGAADRNNDTEHEMWACLATRVSELESDLITVHRGMYENIQRIVSSVEPEQIKSILGGIRQIESALQPARNVHRKLSELVSSLLMRSPDNAGDA